MVKRKPQPRGLGTKATGARVLTLRLLANLSQTQVARACEMSEGAYRFIEQGKSEPRAATLRALCKTLGASADFILFGAPVRAAAATTDAA